MKQKPKSSSGINGTGNSTSQDGTRKKGAEPVCGLIRGKYVAPGMARAGKTKSPQRFGDSSNFQFA